jgi:hypothetical protein
VDVAAWPLTRPCPARSTGWRWLVTRYSGLNGRVTVDLDATLIIAHSAVVGGLLWSISATDHSQFSFKRSCIGRYTPNGRARQCHRRISSHSPRVLNLPTQLFQPHGPTPAPHPLPVTGALCRKLAPPPGDARLKLPATRSAPGHATLRPRPLVISTVMNSGPMVVPAISRMPDADVRRRFGTGVTRSSVMSHHAQIRVFASQRRIRAVPRRDGTRETPGQLGRRSTDHALNDTRVVSVQVPPRTHIRRMRATFDEPVLEGTPTR